MGIASSSENPGLPEIWQELRALRRELAELRQALTPLAGTGHAPALSLKSAVPPLSQPPRQPSAVTLLARCNGERLQQEVRRRLATAASQDEHDLEQEVDTEVDLLIDRLHDLADASSPCP